MGQRWGTVGHMTDERLLFDAADERLEAYLLRVLRGDSAAQDIHSGYPDTSRWPEVRDWREWVAIVRHFHDCPSLTVDTAIGNDGMCGEGTCELAEIEAVARCEHRANLIRYEWRARLTDLFDEIDRVTAGGR